MGYHGTIDNISGYTHGGVAIVWDNEVVACTNKQISISGRLVRVQLRIKWDTNKIGYDVFGVYAPTRKEPNDITSKFWSKLMSAVAIGTTPWVEGALNAEVRTVIDDACNERNYMDSTHK